MSAPFTLTQGAISATIEPKYGGLVSSLCWRQEGRDIALIYSPHSRPKSDTGIHLFGCWPLVPFANRAFDAMLRFEGREIKLPVNDPLSASTMHGFGWQNEWKVEAQTPHSAVLVHESSDGFPPYRYTARQHIEVLENGMKLTLSVLNTGLEPLPFGLGFHPWFPCNARTLFSAKATGKVVLGKQYRPEGRSELELADDFRTPRPVKTGHEIALNFLEWDGLARLDYPGSHSLHIEASETLRAPVFWTPGNADFACFEPQSHAIGAPSELVAQQVAPLQRLAPGERLEGWMRVECKRDMD